MDYKEIIKRGHNWNNNHSSQELNEPRCIIAEMSAAIESLLAEREAAGFKRGKWLQTTKWWQGGSAWKKCSVCGTLNYKSPFCPSCGAKMDLHGRFTPPDRQQSEGKEDEPKEIYNNGKYRMVAIVE